MSRQEIERKPDIAQRVVLALGGVTLLATLVTLALWLFGQRVAAAIIGTATLFSWLALFGVTALAVGSWWSAALMERGAHIALVAQTSDDRRDVAMISAISKLVNWWKQSQPEQRALPLPSQQAEDWMPELAEFRMIDDEVGHDSRDRGKGDGT